jgi:hypothetical protein
VPVLVGLFALIAVAACGAAVILIFIPRLRFLALYVAMAGILGPPSAVISAFGLPVLVERAFHSQLLSILAFWAGLLMGGGLGGLIGLLLAHGIRRLFRALIA